MDTTSQANATQYGIATVLCNCCTATKSNDPESLLGFMIFPKAENKKLHCHRVPLQKQDEKCDECEIVILVNLDNIISIYILKKIFFLL